MKKILTIILFACAIFLTGGCQSNHFSPFSTEIKVSPADSDAAESSLAADSAGNVYVLYVEHGTEKSADVFLQKLDSKLAPLGERVRINSVAGGATAWRGDPPTIKISPNNTIYVGWTSRAGSGSESANNLYLSISRDGGNSFTDPVKVNDDQLPAVHGMHSLMLDKNGAIYFAWLDERFLKNAPPNETASMPAVQSENNSGAMNHEHSEPNREVYFAVSTDDGKSFSANKKLFENACPCCKLSMTLAPDGRLYLSWRQVLNENFRHIAVSSSIDQGANFSAPVIVSDDQWQISACPVSGATMTVNSQNKLQIIWFTAGNAGVPGLYKAESTDNGKSFSPRSLISEGSISGTPVLLQNEIIWESAGQIYKQQNDIKLLGEGNLPFAVTANGGTTYITRLQKENDRRTVWVSAVK